MNGYTCASGGLDVSCGGLQVLSDPDQILQQWQTHVSGDVVPHSRHS